MIRSRRRPVLVNFASTLPAGADEQPSLPLFDAEPARRQIAALAGALASGQWAPEDAHRLALSALRFDAQTSAPDRLMIETYCRDRWIEVGLVPYAYQLNTCRRIIDELQGIAILADEVGLGKTVEAGMVLKEFMLRGLVRNALILCPASLTWQWDLELREKFGIASVRQRSQYDWERADVLVASLDTAKRPPHSAIVLSRHYDMLIVDEAHRLKNAKSANWRFVSAIRRTRCLLLTATPVQNDLRELYNLVTLLAPGRLGTYRQFQQRFMLDRRTPRSARDLRKALHDCVVRNRRGPDTIQFPERRVHALPVEFSPAERAFYDGVSEYLRDRYRRAADFSGVLALITLQREACSSAPATLATLKLFYDRRAQQVGPEAQDDDLQALARLIELGNEAIEVNTKADALVDLIAGSDEQFIVFTEYRMTQQYIRWRLAQAGIFALPFDGSMSASKKEWTRHLFHKAARVLVCTESGGEGLNFQFCRNVVNFDLPWNPMRLEQRIGRVHRLGQTRPVNIYNMATKDTVEEYILYLLHEKLNMFQAVVGDGDGLLARLHDERTFEQSIADIVLTGEGREDTVRRLDAFGERMLVSPSPDPSGSIIDGLYGDEP